jgi:hypothetical protein
VCVHVSVVSLCVLVTTSHNRDHDVRAHSLGCAGRSRCRVAAARVSNDNEFGHDVGSTAPR